MPDADVSMVPPTPALPAVAETMDRPGVTPAVFDTLYEGGFDYVWNALRRLGVPEKDAEDACHDVFVAVHRRLAEYDTSRPLKPWLCGFAVRVAANYRRKASSRMEVMPGDLPERGDPVGQAAEDATNRQLVAAAMTTLKDTQRVMLVLHDVEGYSIPDLCGMLMEPEGTLYSRLRTARLQFAAAVKALLQGRSGP